MLCLITGPGLRITSPAGSKIKANLNVGLELNIGSNFRLKQRLRHGRLCKYVMDFRALNVFGWQIGMECKGLKVNIGKTEVMVSSRKGTKVNIKDSQGTSLRQVNKFKYLVVTISEEGGSEEAVRERVSAAWGKWSYQ